MARKNAGPDPWERQKGETVKAYEAFLVYVELGHTRSLVKVGERLGKNRVTIERWSSRWQWVWRVGKYAEHLLGQRAAADTEDLTMLRAEARARNRAIGDQMQDLAERGLGALADIQLPDGTPLNVLKPADIAKFAEAGSKLTSLGVGSATDIVRGTLLVQPHEVRAIAESAIEIALRHIPPEAHDAFIREIEEAWG